MTITDYTEQLNARTLAATRIDRHARTLVQLATRELIDYQQVLNPGNDSLAQAIRDLYRLDENLATIVQDLGGEG